MTKTKLDKSKSTGFQKVRENALHNSYVFNLVDTEFIAPDGERLQRDIVRHPGAVAVVAVEEGQIVLVRQFRPSIESNLLEIPAGKLEPDDESPEVAAKRELVEEAGVKCGALVLLGSFLNSPGFTDEVTHIFLATQLQHVEVERDEGEERWMTVNWVNIDSVWQMIESGEIRDAKTVVGILLAMRTI